MKKVYLIRLSNPLTWAYFKSSGGWRVAYASALKRFGGRLVAFEPSPVSPRKMKDYEVFE